MPDNEKEGGKIWEQKRVCSYCDKEKGGEDLGLVHRNKKGNPDWSVCFDCFKKGMDKALGKKSKLAEKVEKCVYCGKQFFGPSETRPYFSHSNENGVMVWGICYECVKKAFDNIFKNNVRSI